jgi:CubicO group peptidase (beta-lactamase class C family)
MRTGTACLVLAVLLLGAAPPFSAAKARAIDTLARAELHSGSTPGLAIGVVQDGLLVYARGFGYANVKTKRRVTPSTQFYAGSLSKQFTAACVLLLAQQKKLSLDDKVTKYVPELSVARNATIAQLLQQTSGLPDYTKAPGIPHDLTRPIDLETLIKAVNRMQPASTPGSAFAYNNFNYMIAGLIVQRVGGIPLSVAYATQIFQPLIMTSSFLAGDQGISPLHALGYTRANRKFVPVRTWDPSWLFGAGGLVTTLQDLAKWDVGLPILLNVDSVRQMWTPGIPGGTYGMGWMIDQRGGQRYLWHNGEIAGYHAMNALLPDQHLAVIVLANADALGEGTTVQPERLASRILDIIAPPAPAHFADPITTRATEWLGRLERIDIDRSQLTPAFSQYLSDQVVERADFAALGPVLSMVPEESYQRSGDTVYVFQVKFGRGAFRYDFTLAPDGKIDGLLLRP